MKRVSWLKAGHSNTIFSVRDIVRGTDGAVLQSYDYKENGDKTSSTSLKSDKTWIGGLSVNDDTADSGLYLMGHRHYDASLGRFLSRDPIGFDGGLNLHEYAASSPVGMTDALGLQPGEQHAVYDGSGYGMDPASYTIVNGPRPPRSYSPPPADDISLLDPNLVKALKGHAKKWGLPVGGVLGLATVAGAYSMVGGSSRGFGRRGGERGFANFRQPCNESGTNRNPNKLGPLPDATGEHSTFRRGPDGIVTNYEVYDLNPVTGLFGAQKRFRGVGKPHNGVAAPFVLERAPGKGPGSTPSTVRAPELWELPGGY